MIINYMSSLKIFVLDKFGVANNHCFEEGWWENALWYCQIEKLNLNRMNGKPNQENNDYANDKEPELFAVLSMWDNYKNFAFFSFE